MKETSLIFLYCALFAACMATSPPAPKTSLNNSNPVCAPQYYQNNCPCASASGVAALAADVFPQKGYVLLILPTAASGLPVLIEYTLITGPIFVFTKVIGYVIFVPGASLFLNVYSCPFIKPLISPGVVYGTQLTNAELLTMSQIPQATYTAACNVFTFSFNYNGRGATLGLSSLQSFAVFSASGTISSKTES